MLINLFDKTILLTHFEPIRTFASTMETTAGIYLHTLPGNGLTTITMIETRIRKGLVEFAPARSATGLHILYYIKRTDIKYRLCRIRNHKALTCTATAP